MKPTRPFSVWYRALAHAAKITAFDAHYDGDNEMTYKVLIASRNILYKSNPKIGSDRAWGKTPQEAKDLLMKTMTNNFHRVKNIDVSDVDFMCIG